MEYMTELKATLILVFFMVYFSPVCAYDVEFEIDMDDTSDALPAALLKGAEKAYSMNLKGLDALELDKYDEALVCFKNAAEMLPNYTDAINNCDVVYCRRGNIVLARETWEKVLKMDPAYAIAYYN